VTRVLPAGVAGEIALENAQRIHLLELEFSGGTVYLCDAAQNVTVGAQSYTALGGLIEVGDVEETRDDKGQGLELALSGVDQSIVSVLLTNFYRGRACRLYRVYLSAAGTVIGDRILLFPGLMNEAWTITGTRDEGLGAGTVRITTRVVSRLAGMGGQVRGIRTNIVSHQRHFTGELFFQHVSGVAARINGVRWPGTGTGNSGWTPHPRNEWE